MELRPIPSITNLHGRPIDSMKVNIIFAHELIQLDILRVKPPLFPFRGIVGRDTRIANRGIELFYNHENA